MGQSMAHTAHQPGPVCLEGRRCEPLAGRGGGFGGVELNQGAHTRRVGRCLLQFEWLSKTRGAQARKAWLAGVAELLRPLFPGGGGRRNKAVAFHNPQAFSNVQEENRSCARDQ
jgi:hypothetical protein